jgi:hypothetical protein
MTTLTAARAAEYFVAIVVVAIGVVAYDAFVQALSGGRRDGDELGGVVWPATDVRTPSRSVLSGRR